MKNHTNDLDSLLPKLQPIELAIAIETCKEAGAVNAAIALSKHIEHLNVVIERLQERMTSDARDRAD